MKTVLDKLVRDELISRINSISENSQPAWGEMNAYQMLKHCSIAEESYLGKKKYNRTLFGRLVGKKVLHHMLKDESPMMRNAKTIKPFVVTGNGNIELEKQKWIALINEYVTFSKNDIVHWFFWSDDKRANRLFLLQTCRSSFTAVQLLIVLHQ